MRLSAEKVDELEVAADVFHWCGAPKILRQLGAQLSIKQFTIEQAVKRLDTLYSNDKYSELDLGQALETLAMQVEATEPPGSRAIDVPQVSASIA
jgi:hypothetical protein